MKLKTKIASITALTTTMVTPLMLIGTTSCSKGSGLFGTNNVDANYKPTDGEKPRSELRDTTYSKGQEDYKKAFADGKVDPNQEVKWMTAIQARAINGALPELNTMLKKQESDPDPIKLNRYGYKFTDFHIDNKEKNIVSYTIAQEWDITVDLDIASFMKLEGMALKISANFKLGYQVEVKKMSLNFFLIESTTPVEIIPGDPEWIKELKSNLCWYVAPDGLLLEENATDWGVKLDVKSNVTGTLNDKDLGTALNLDLNVDWNTNSNVYKSLEEMKSVRAKITKIIGLTGGWMSYYMSSATKKKIITETFGKGFTKNPENGIYDQTYTLDLSDGNYGHMTAEINSDYKAEDCRATIIANILEGGMPNFGNENVPMHIFKSSTSGNKFTLDDIDWYGYRTSEGHNTSIEMLDDMYRFGQHGGRIAYINNNLDWIVIGDSFSPVEHYNFEINDSTVYPDKEYGFSEKELRATAQVITYDPIKFDIEKDVYTELKAWISAGKLTDNPVSIAALNNEVVLDTTYAEAEEGWEKLAGSGWAIKKTDDEYSLRIMPKFANTPIWVDPVAPITVKTATSYPFVINVVYNYILPGQTTTTPAVYVTDTMYLKAYNNTAL